MLPAAIAFIDPSGEPITLLIDEAVITNPADRKPTTAT
jgi:hypothetical protein